MRRTRWTSEVIWQILLPRSCKYHARCKVSFHMLQVEGKQEFQKKIPKRTRKKIPKQFSTPRSRAKKPKKSLNCLIPAPLGPGSCSFEGMWHVLGCVGYYCCKKTGQGRIMTHIFFWAKSWSLLDSGIPGSVTQKCHMYQSTPATQIGKKSTDELPNVEVNWLRINAYMVFFSDPQKNKLVSTCCNGSENGQKKWICGSHFSRTPPYIDSRGFWTHKSQRFWGVGHESRSQRWGFRSLGAGLVGICVFIYIYIYLSIYIYIFFFWWWFHGNSYGDLMVN